jgi:hypothetical protein
MRWKEDDEFMNAEEQYTQEWEQILEHASHCGRHRQSIAPLLHSVVGTARTHADTLVYRTRTSKSRFSLSPDTQMKQGQGQGQEQVHRK